MTENPKRYPHSLKLDEVADKDHYAKRAECRNCGYSYWWIIIPKGTTVESFKRTLTCEKCEITGMWVIY